MARAGRAIARFLWEIVREALRPFLRRYLHREEHHGIWCGRLPVEKFSPSILAIDRVNDHAGIEEEDGHQERSRCCSIS
jgi:hypothetical protein